MKAEVLEEVKKEVEKMITAGFIRPCRYVEWISSIVPIQKKDGRWRVCVDFRDLNRATPKDEYPMLVAETLINAVASHKMLSFMDGNCGRTNLNYTGSSTQVHSRGLQRTSNGIIPWPVG
jgi:hypothetical protein